MEEAELTEIPDAEVTEEREEWTIERTYSSGMTRKMKKENGSVTFKPTEHKCWATQFRDNTLISLKC